MSFNDGDDDYSPSATLIKFDPPISLLRGPIPASPKEDPNLGPFVLAFPNPKSFISTLKSSESKLLEQCEAGVRIGCSISASNKCRPAWWKTLFLGGPTEIDFRERNECEEREMAACLDGSKEKCFKFAKEKCVGPFGWARVGFGFDLAVANQVGCEEGSYIRGSEILGNENKMKENH